MTKKEFLEKFTETNSEWVAQQLLIVHTPAEIAQMRHHLKKFYETAYKEWARENMSLTELLHAFEIIKGLK